MYFPLSSFKDWVIARAVAEQFPRAIRETHNVTVYYDQQTQIGYARIATKDGSRYFTFALERGPLPDTDLETDVVVPEFALLQMCVVA